MSLSTIRRMTDPLIGGAVAKATGAALTDASRTIGELLNRALGPTADVVGEYWRERSQAFFDNRRRILAKAAEKSERLGIEGPANLRVADKVFIEGSSVDDELTAEYFSGLLAASRTPDGRDDRAVAWTNAVARLSSSQLRLHYLLYREWAERLRGSGLNLALQDGRTKATAEILYSELLLSLSPQVTIASDGTLSASADTLVGVFEHALLGLVREGLLDSGYGYGPRDLAGRPDSRFAGVVWVRPSPSGVELFGWALGHQGLTCTRFVQLPPIVDLEPPVPRLVNFEIPDLSE